jgi:ABC-type sugar transport system ATPase subunit
MNIFSAQVAEGGGLQLPGGFSMSLPETTLSPGPVQVGIRPEKIGLSATQGAGDYPVQIDFVEKLGAGELFYIHLGEEQLVVSLPAGEQLARLQMNGCFARFAPEDLYLFSPKTGKRVD